MGLHHRTILLKHNWLESKCCGDWKVTPSFSFVGWVRDQPHWRVPECNIILKMTRNMSSCTCAEKQFKCCAPLNARDAHNPKNSGQVSGAWPLQPSNWRFQVLAVNFVKQTMRYFELPQQLFHEFESQANLRLPTACQMWLIFGESTMGGMGGIVIQKMLFLGFRITKIKFFFNFRISLSYWSLYFNCLLEFVF